MPSRRPLLAALVALSLGGVTVALGGSGSATASTPTSSIPVFSHGAVVDEQRTGFEPGIQVDSKDRLYTSVPYGFSDTQSFLWSSEDHGNSYQLIPASVGTGKTQTCVGGGDSELALDKKDDLFFSDLQGLTNLSNSVTTDQGRTFNASCTSSPNTPVDRMWYAVHGSLGDPDFAIYEEYDDVDGGLNAGTGATSNQLVETVSHDGVTFTPVLNSDLTNTGCTGGGVLNCVTDDEGIPGNQVLTKDGKHLVIAHTGADSNLVSVSIGTLSTDATTGATSATWKTVPVNKDICPDVASTPSATEQCGAALFSTITEDTAGNLYLVSASKSQDSAGTQTSPYSVFLWHSTDGGNTWSKGVKASGGGSNAFPWITAGDPGRLDITYYHATQSGSPGHYQFDDLSNGSFTVEMSQTLNALSATPSFTRTQVSEHPIKYGPICTSGLGCTVSGGDRSLGDYLQVGHDAQGAAVVAYVDDTSNAYSTGPAATGSQVANAGPPEVVRQIGGPSLFVGKTVTQGPGPGRAMDSVTDPGGDTYYSANGTKTPAGDNLDLTASSIKDDGKGGLTITMKVKSLASLMPSPTAGGTTAEWITRFTTFNGGKTPGNGHILYAGMESVAGGAPSFYAGDVAAAPQLFLNFGGENTITGSYTPAGLITLHVPKADLAEVPTAKTTAEKTLYSATAFTATSLTPIVGDPEGLFNLTDATTPFDHVVGAKAATPGKPSTPTKPGTTPGAGGSGGSAGGHTLPTTGLRTAAPLLGSLLLLLVLVVRRRRA